MHARGKVLTVTMEWKLAGQAPYAIPYFIDKSGTVWCEDAESIKKKIEMAEKLGIDRFALWRLGGEDPGIWKILKKVQKMQ